MMNSKGREVEGLAKAATPSRVNSKANKPAPQANITKPNSSILNPDFKEQNPKLKGFKNAHYPSPQAALPLRPQRMVEPWSYE